MKVKQLQSIGAGALNLPNSACMLKNGNIAVADGGNNRIVIFDASGRQLFSHGEQGFAPHNLREPIFIAASPDQYLFVSDWHNHRVLVFEPDLKFSHTLFYLGPIHPAKTIRQRLLVFELFLKHLLTEKVGAQYYFSKDQVDVKSKYSFLLFINGLRYYSRNLIKLKNILFSRELSVRKVNGIAFDKNRIVITQKANRCLSSYRIDDEKYQNMTLERHIQHYPDGTPFGRLCNISRGDDGKYYVCDQNNWRIAILDKSLSFDNILTFEQRGDLPIGPFSCALIAPQILAISMSYGIEIHDLKSKTVLWKSPKMGETHGIAWDKESKTLHYVDRSNGCIERFKVDF